MDDHKHIGAALSETQTGNTTVPKAEEWVMTASPCRYIRTASCLWCDLIKNQIYCSWNRLREQPGAPVSLWVISQQQQLGLAQTVRALFPHKTKRWKSCRLNAATHLWVSGCVHIVWTAEYLSILPGSVHQVCVAVTEGGTGSMLPGPKLSCCCCPVYISHKITWCLLFFWELVFLFVFDHLTTAEVNYCRFALICCLEKENSPILLEWYFAFAL